jgi:hypothetical protein
MNREAFKKWFLDTQGYDPFSKRLNQESEERAMTAWEGWQASSNKAIESLAPWMLSRGFSTGHGDTIDDLLAELGGQIDDLLSAGKEKTE